MRKDQIKILRAALGIGFVTDEITQNNFRATELAIEKTCQELTEMGYMVDHGPQPIVGNLNYYHVTPEGIQALRKELGLKEEVYD